MQVIKILPRGFGCNTYAVTADGKRAVLIDCADIYSYEQCLARGLTPVAALLTHGHFDHVGGCGALYEKGVPIYCGEGEKDYIFSDANKSLFGGVYIPDFEIHKTLSDGEQTELAGVSFSVISASGHTAGGVCYLAEDSLFTGDTLFRLGIGRYDLPTADYSSLVKSIKRLYALNGDYKVFCGHGGDTTLSYERRHNPYVRS